MNWIRFLMIPLPDESADMVAVEKKDCPGFGD
jgi:hypothetical protein